MIVPQGKTNFLKNNELPSWKGLNFLGTYVSKNLAITIISFFIYI
jgi:hypothetical protein